MIQVVPRFFTAVLTSASVAVGLGVCLPAAKRLEPIESTRLRVFISDLHLGVGRQPNGAWRNMEDFRWLDEFRLFLDEIDRSGNSNTDLIVVGDAFELWQSTLVDCVFPEKDFGCTEAEALGRLTRVIANHRDELAALGAFAKKGSNSVVLVPGNHDAALVFASVAQSAVNATGAAGRVTVNASGAWISPDGVIYAEHGHQIGKEVNRFDGWPRPFVGTPDHLQRPWGEQFVQHYYNRFEEKYPIIDNILSEGVGVHYAMKAEGKAETVADIGRLVGFFTTKLSWAQYGGVLGGGANQPPSWDIDAIRKQGDQFLIESMPPDDPLRKAVEQASKDKTLGVSISDLTDGEIREICDARSELNAAEPRVRLVTPPQPCPTTAATLGALSQAALRRSRDDILSEHFDLRSRELAGSQPNAREFQIFVYGHTHAAETSFAPKASTFAPWQPIAINTGAWQRVIDPVDLERWRAGRPHGTVLGAQPSDLPACYSLVLVRPYQAKATAELKFWAQTTGRWQLMDSCPGWTPPIR
jgi:UDP-2,3-diacylglucosamine pyrophosphatase LpxH